MFDISTLTLGESAFIERKSGISMAAMGDPDTPKAAMTAALACVLKRRETPGFTYEDALNLTMTEAETIIGMDDPGTQEDAGPTPPAPVPAH